MKLSLKYFEIRQGLNQPVTGVVCLPAPTQHVRLAHRPPDVAQPRLVAPGAAGVDPIDDLVGGSQPHRTVPPGNNDGNRKW